MTSKYVQNISVTEGGKQGSPGQLGSSVDSASAAPVTSLPVKKQQLVTPKWAQVKFKNYFFFHPYVLSFHDYPARALITQLGLLTCSSTSHWHSPYTGAQCWMTQLA